jgi:hypothetical protein
MGFGSPAKRGIEEHEDGQTKSCIGFLIPLAFALESYVFLLKMKIMRGGGEKADGLACQFGPIYSRETRSVLIPLRFRMRLRNRPSYIMAEGEEHLHGDQKLNEQLT